VDDADFIGEKRVQGDPRGPGGPPHNFGGIRSFGKKYVALPSAWPRHTPLTAPLRLAAAYAADRSPPPGRGVRH